MAVTFGAIGARTNKAAVAATDTINPALPAGVVAGDRLIIFASSLRDATTFSADQSYVKTRQNTKIAILEKNAGSSEVAPTVTFGGLTVGDLISAIMLRFPGGTDTKDWSNVTGASSATSLPGPPLTVTDSASVGVVIGYQPNDKTGATFTANGWTEQEYSFTTTGTDGTHYVATQDGLAAGSQTMPSWAWSGGLEYRAISFSVPPATGSGATLAADTGAYSVTGSSATLRAAHFLSASAGSFSIQGQDATLRVGYNLQAEAGSFSIAGGDASLTVARRLMADVGTVVISGVDASLVGPQPVPQSNQRREIMSLSLSLMLGSIRRP